jgi:hypothetical protein
MCPVEAVQKQNNKPRIKIEAASSSQSDDGVLQVTYDEDGKVTLLSFGGSALPQEALNRVTKHANTLLFIACRLGNLLSVARHKPLTVEDTVLLEGPQAEKFYDTIKKADWYVALFGEKKPFDFKRNKAELTWDITTSPTNGPGSSIRRVVVSSHQAQFDSASTESRYFEVLDKEFKARIADYAFAIAQSVTFGAKDFAKALQQAHKNIVRGEDRAFNEAYKHIKSFSQVTNDLRCFHMHLLSLISPQDWFRDGPWEKFYKHIHYLTCKSDNRPDHRVHRRLHILDRATENDPDAMICLLDVMLCDLRHFLDSKCLVIDPEKVSYRANVPIYKESLLVNAGTFSMRGGHHAVILSTGRPYFEKVSDGDFGVYPDVGNHTAATYYYLRHNFQHFYNPGGGSMHNETIWCVSDVIKKVKSHIQSGKIHPLPLKLRYFVGAKCDIRNIESEIDTLLSVLTQTAPDDRDLELAEWFLTNRKPDL